MSLQETSPSFTEVYPPNIEVDRGFFKELAADLEAECRAYLKPSFATIHPVGWCEKPDKFQRVARRRFPVGELRSLGKDATLTLVDTLMLPDSAFITVNEQPPNSAQPFHKERSVVQVVHASDDGTFDYAPFAKCADAAEKYAAKPISVQAGDVLRQLQPEEYHRGRNTSDHWRFNMVVYPEVLPPRHLAS